MKNKSSTHYHFSLMNNSKSHISFQNEVSDILGSAMMGLWQVVLKDNKSQLFIDDVCGELMGLEPGVSAEDAFKFFSSCIDKDSVELFAEYNQRLFNGEHAEVTYFYNHPKRGKLAVRCSGYRDLSYKGEGIRLRGCHNDVSIYQKALDAAEESAKKHAKQSAEFLTMLENLQDLASWFMYFDQDGNVTEINWGCIHNLLGYTKEEFPNTIESWSSRIYEEDREQTISKCLGDLTDLGSYSDLFRMVNKVGEIRWIRCKASTSYYDNGKPRLFYGTLKDNTQRLKNQKKIQEQREEIEAALRDAERANNAKTLFLNNMSHDIRTPMNAILGMTQIAKKNINDEKQLLDCLEKIEISSGHLLALINEVLDLSKLEAGKLELKDNSVDLVEILKTCHTVLAPLASNMNVEFITHSEMLPIHKNIMTSELHLRQVLINLGSNAIKYNRRGGFLDVQLKERLIDKDHVEYTFIFQDSGIGMSEDFLQKVFQPFAQENITSRTKFEGTGLGLSIVKKIVDLMGGTISVESKKDVGSKFVVVIPFEIDHSKDNEIETKKSHQESTYVLDESIQRLGKLHILLVEDNDLNTEIAQYMLEEEGATVDTAENGEIAVEKVRENSYDLVLMDIMMPVMNGYTATQKIREFDSEIPIIAMTANAFEEDREQAFKSGMNEHLAKPIDINSLVKTITKVLNS